MPEEGRGEDEDEQERRVSTKGWYLSDPTGRAPGAFEYMMTPF